MFYKQLAFRSPEFNPEESRKISGGIGLYEPSKDNPGVSVLSHVICGCCGSTFEPDEIEIVEIYEHWIDLTDTIVS